jgi:hypothetical protein
VTLPRRDEASCCLLVAVLCALGVGCTAPKPAAHFSTSPSASPRVSGANLESDAVPAAYFGIHAHRLVGIANEPASPWPDIGVGSIRLWDAYVSWADLEPAPRVWRFARLDSLIALAETHRAAVYLTLGRTPRWASSHPDERSAYGLGEQAMPRDLATWTAYVDTVARRYRGRIAAYEIWNEPNQAGMFSGSVDDMATLASAAFRSVKTSDPDAIVITPSPTHAVDGIDWMLRFKRAGGLRSADVVGFHPYVTNDPPEALVPLISQLVARLADSTHVAKPIWITELGWFVQDADGSVRGAAEADAFDHLVLSDTLAAAYVGRALALGWCSGAKRLMWYAWDNDRMGLLEHDHRREKLAATAYRALSSWLAGATVSTCSRAPNGQWQLSIVRTDHTRASIRWSERPAPVGSPSQQSVEATAINPVNPSAADIAAATRWNVPVLISEHAGP